MREMDEPSLGIPDVLAVHDDVITDRHRDTRTNVEVVLYQHGEIPGRQFEEELLVMAGRSRSLGQYPDNGPLSGDLDM